MLVFIINFEVLSEKQKNMDMVLIHGMGRTPLSMLLLRYRLHKQGHRAILFGYSPTFESMHGVTQRLVQLIQTKMDHTNYALVGHSLGSVIVRNALPQLGIQQPSICFFLTPPMVACRAAKFFSGFWIYRCITGEMGHLLAQEKFMSQLAMPSRTKIYAGTAGPRIAWLPLGMALNDGILLLEEASAANVGNAANAASAEVVNVPATHTFIMNSKVVLNDIVRTLQ